MKAFSPAGMAVKAFFGYGAKTIGNPTGQHPGGGSGPTPPPAPTMHTGVSGTGFGIVYWSTVPGATYNLYRSVNGGAFSLFQSGLIDTSYEDNTVSGANTYTYQVVAVVSAVDSAPSAPTTVHNGTTLALFVTADSIPATLTGASGLALSSLMTAPQKATLQAGGYDSVTLALSGAPARGYWVVTGSTPTNVNGSQPGAGLVVDIFNNAGAMNLVIRTTSQFRLYGGGSAGADTARGGSSNGGDAIAINATANTVNVFLDNGTSFILPSGGGGGGAIVGGNGAGGGGAAGWLAEGSFAFDTPQTFDVNSPTSNRAGNPKGTLAVAGALGNPAGNPSGGNGGGLGQNGFAGGGAAAPPGNAGFALNRNGSPGATVVLSGAANIVGTLQ